MIKSDSICLVYFMGQSFENTFSITKTIPNFQVLELDDYLFVLLPKNCPKTQRCYRFGIKFVEVQNSFQNLQKVN